MTARFPAPHRTRGSAATFSSALVATVLVALLLAPVATANHWYLHREGHDDSVARTLEPDDAVVHAAGNVFDGLVNRITLAHETFGEGLFLDAFVGTSASPTTPTLHPRFYSETVLGRSDVLLPGNQHLAAWYGWWNDYDGDGAILDIHDGECGSALCPDDEFRWRGLGSGNPEVAVVAFVIPAQRSTVVTTPHRLSIGFFSAYGNAGGADRYDLRDGTSHENEELGWQGAMFPSFDGGFLTRITTVTIAGAQPTTVNPGFSLNDPAGLYDVDHYEAANADVEPLYLATLSTLREADPYPGIHDAILRDIQDQVMPIVASVTRTVAEVVADARSPDRVISRGLIPPDPREPNHPDDDYEGRALYGGVGDVAGSHNTYPGYEHDYGFFFDNVVRTFSCAGVRATTPVGIDATQYVCLPFKPVNLAIMDPIGAQSPGGRNASTILQFMGSAFVWRDNNGDGYVGWVCNPEDPEQFDGETRTCRDPPHPWPGWASQAREACSVSSLAGSSVVLTPVGGNWPNVVVLRDTSGLPTSTEVHHEVVSDGRPIMLRYRDSCSSSSISGRDALLFPTGLSSIGVRVVAEATLPRFHDSNAGIDLAQDQKVVDVDYLPPSL